MIKKIFISLFLFLGIAFYLLIVFPFWGMPFNSDLHQQLPLTPAWALECWLWEDDVNTSEYVDELLNGYKKHDIPVRTIIIDSPWSLRYNDFQIDTQRYQNPKQWFYKLDTSGYRVVLWMTPLVNRFSKDAKIKDSKDWSQQQIDKGYLVANDDQIKWWKGVGGFIDYTNPKALDWWHQQQQSVYEYGIDGWKLDGAATYFSTDVFGFPLFYKKTSKGIMTTRGYMNEYYRQEYFYGLKQNPEFVTLSRAIDHEIFHPEGFAPFDASPINWVGDQKHTWKSEPGESEAANTDLLLDGVEGIEMAIEHILASAQLGYNLIGSDVAGFSGRTIPPELYIRWAQFSSFCGLFMNGGHGERRLWKRTKEELEIIRKFSWLHTELIPYMYHYVHTAHADYKRLQTVLKKGKYQYLFGDDFLVAPIYKNSKKRSIELPAGKWRYFFDDKKLIQGPLAFQQEFPMDEYPVFVKEGAIIPMNIKRDYTNLGTKENEGFTTILIYPLEASSFTLYDLSGKGTTEIICKKTKSNINVMLNGKKIPHILNIHAEQVPKQIALDHQTLIQNENWTYNTPKQKIEIKTNTYKNGNYLISF